MVRPTITNSLKGALGETYYKELCNQKGWAYCSLENLYGCNLDCALFKKGFDRLRVCIPEEIRQEVRRIATPSNHSLSNPNYVFDYLACKIGDTDHSQVQYPETFYWAEIKTGLGIFSTNQYNTLSTIQLQIAVFHIDDVLAKPQDIEMQWKIMSGTELAHTLRHHFISESMESFFDSTFAMYDSTCAICGRRISKDVHKITKKNGLWVHEHCA